MSTTTSLAEDLDRLAQQAQTELESATEEAALEAWRVSYLGRNGALAALLKRLGTLPADERPAAGQAANRVKAVLEGSFDARLHTIQSASRALELEGERIDVSLPAQGVRRG